MGDTLERDLENPGSPEEEEIARLGPWFHNLHLENGLQTAPGHPLGDFPAIKWKEVEPYLPDVDGWRVLDIGCNAGFYSFELARRGARVTAIDIDERYLKQARWAARQYGLEDRVEFQNAQIYDVAGWEESFDLIWFMGVLYHLRYPMLALDIVTRKVKKLLVLQTLSMPGREEAERVANLDLHARERMRQPGWPKMAFIEESLAGDPTNWWAPNHACIQAMLRSCGFTDIRSPAHEIYMCRDIARDQLEKPFLRAQYESATGISRGRRG